MRKQGGISLGERVTSACIGALFGALIGAALVWLWGVYSQTLGPGHGVAHPVQWVLTMAAALAAYGFVRGSHVGSLVGDILSGLFEFERQDREIDIPVWLAVFFWACVVAAVVWWLG